jgi:mannose-1-phosphate guanylyltransferase
MDVPVNAYGLILAGGGGTRLWPRSRQKTPKHLLNLFGDVTMLQMAVDRLSAVLPRERIIIITHKDHLEQAKNQVQDLPSENWIVEPQAKNTALAMGMAAANIYKRDPRAIILNSYADHLITNVEEFKKVMTTALVAIEEHPDNLLTIGIKPTFPHTGLGYIKVGGEIDSNTSYEVKVCECLGFKEKPDLATAQEFLESGNYVWNSGFYCWSALALFKALERYSPDIYSLVSEVLQATTNDTQSLIEELYTRAENIQIDYAVSEKADNMLVIAAEFDWSDVGDWKVVYDLGKKDDLNNMINSTSDVVNISTQNTLIQGSSKLIATVGVDNLVIVDTGDVLLVCNKDTTQDVKKLVEKLKELKKDQYL